MAKNIVKLNVGGTYYTTTRTTLTQYPESMLGSMFNGSFPETKDENGYYFIDRNGPMFQYVLDYLRSSTLALPKDFPHLDQLCLEADFYQIKPLIEELSKYKTNHLPTHFQPETAIEVVECVGHDLQVADPSMAMVFNPCTKRHTFV